MDNTNHLIAALPVLWECLSKIALTNDELALARKRRRDGKWSKMTYNAYDEVLLSVLNLSATIRQTIATVDKKRGITGLIPSWVIFYCDQEECHDVEFMLKFSMSLTLNKRARWFAYQRPQALRRYVETGYAQICNHCATEFNLTEALAGVQQCDSPSYQWGCVLESGSRTLLYSN